MSGRKWPSGAGRTWFLSFPYVMPREAPNSLPEAPAPFWKPSASPVFSALAVNPEKRPISREPRLFSRKNPRSIPVFYPRFCAPACRIQKPGRRPPALLGAKGKKAGSQMVFSPHPIIFWESSTPKRCFLWNPPYSFFLCQERAVPTMNWFWPAPTARPPLLRRALKKETTSSGLSPLIRSYVPSACLETWEKAAAHPLFPEDLRWYLYQKLLSVSDFSGYQDVSLDLNRRIRRLRFLCMGKSWQEILALLKNKADNRSPDPARPAARPSGALPGRHGTFPCGGNRFLCQNPGLSQKRRPASPRHKRKRPRSPALQALRRLRRSWRFRKKNAFPGPLCFASVPKHPVRKAFSSFSHGI